MPLACTEPDVKSGFRGVAPFMRGYAPTEAPRDGRYQTALLSQDVLALIAALGYEQACLIGNDWGATAVSGAAVLAPENVTKLVTIASGQANEDLQMDFQFLKGTWHSYYFQLPMAEATLAHNDFAFIEAWWRDAAPEWDIPKEYIQSIKETFRKPGVVEAALGYYRARYNQALQDSSLEDVQRRISAGPITVPTLALHGTSDRPKRIDAFESRSMDLFFTGGLEKVIIPGTGHFMHQEKPDQVNPQILEFIAR